MTAFILTMHYFSRCMHACVWLCVYVCVCGWVARICQWLGCRLQVAVCKLQTRCIIGHFQCAVAAHHPQS